jgi:histone H3/H4
MDDTTDSSDSDSDYASLVAKKKIQKKAKLDLASKSKLLKKVIKAGKDSDSDDSDSDDFLSTIIKPLKKDKKIKAVLQKSKISKDESDSDDSDSDCEPAKPQVKDIIMSLDGNDIGEAELGEFDNLLSQLFHGANEKVVEKYIKPAIKGYVKEQKNIGSGKFLAKNKMTKGAGLQLDCYVFLKFIKCHTKENNLQCGKCAVIYLTAVCEYLMAEILELSGNACREESKETIEMKHIQRACASDEELCVLIHGDETCEPLEGIDEGIIQVLGQVHPELSGCDDATMQYLKKCCMYFSEEFMRVSVMMCKYVKRKTLDSRAIQASVRIIFPGELAKHAVSEGCTAVTKFTYC